jgi:hypothetical protein
MGAGYLELPALAWLRDPRVCTVSMGSGCPAFGDTPTVMSTCGDNVLPGATWVTILGYMHIAMSRRAHQSYLAALPVATYPRHFDERERGLVTSSSDNLMGSSERTSQ